MNGGAFVHPTAVVDPGAEVGGETRIWHFCHVMPGARIGRRCVLGQNVFVGPGVRIGDDVRIQNNVSVYEGVEIRDGAFIGPSVVFTNVRRPRSLFPRKHAFGRTLIEEGATLGANATILPGVTVGACALVAAGSVATSDVAPFAEVSGVPARISGFVCRCGERLARGAIPPLTARVRCGACGRWYRSGATSFMEDPA